MKTATPPLGRGNVTETLLAEDVPPFKGPTTQFLGATFKRTDGEICDAFVIRALQPDGTFRDRSLSLRLFPVLRAAMLDFEEQARLRHLAKGKATSGGRR